MSLPNREDLYTIVKTIGAGSFGQVYLVRQSRENRQYVMKKISSVSQLESKERESAELEVKLLQTLRHPNIVAYKDSFVNSEDNLCLVMEYCEHGDVYVHLQNAKKAGKLPGEPVIIDWFIQVVLALHALHQKKILHRDLKTQNIFLTGNKEHNAFALKLGDFGIAKVLDSSNQFAMTRIGTPFYMSPELFKNKPYDYKSDVWGLGCVLYEMINGRHAFDAQSLNGLAFKILKGSYTPCNPSSSQATKDLIQSLLRTNPSHRPTLKETLHAPWVRRKISLVVKHVMTILPEHQQGTSSVIHEQLASIGLGALVNAGGPTRKDQQKVLQRLEKAKNKRRKKEETLRFLEDSLAQLDGSLRNQGQHSHRDTRKSRGTHSPSRSSHDDRKSFEDRRSSTHGKMSVRSASEDALQELNSPSRDRPHRSKDHVSSSSTAHAGWRSEEAHRPSKQRPARRPERIAMMAGQPAYQQDIASQRDHVLQQKELKRREEQRRFEEEARGIREENLAHQRAWVHGRHQTSSAMKSAFGNNHEGDPARALGGAILRPPHNGRSLGGLSPPPMMEHEHSAQDDQYNPFSTSRTAGPKIMHISKRHRHHHEPAAPVPPRYGSPMPPQNVPPRNSGNHWRQAGVSASGDDHQLRSVRSVTCLEALNIERMPQNDDYSEDSHSSAAFSDRSLSDISEDGDWDPNHEHLKQQVQAMYQQIDQCRAAIYRHKMTEETYEYQMTFEQQENQERQRNREADRDHAESEWDNAYRDGDPDLGVVAPPIQEHRSNHHPGVLKSSRGQAPVLVQDRMALLSRRCVEGLGQERFQHARRQLQMAHEGPPMDDVSLREMMVDALGEENIGFFALISQIIFMEVRYNRRELQ